MILFILIAAKQIVDEVACKTGKSNRPGMSAGKGSKIYIANSLLSKKVVSEIVY